MEIRFYVDPQTGHPHIHGHGVEEWEVEDVLRRPQFGYRSREDSRVALGQTRDGRYLKVIYVRDDGQNSFFVITAYPLSWRGLRRLRRRRKNNV